MNYNFKYDIGEDLWYISNRKAIEIRIESLHIYRTKSGKIGLKYVTNRPSFYEDEMPVYKTKEECNLAIIEEIAGETK